MPMAGTMTTPLNPIAGSTTPSTPPAVGGSVNDMGAVASSSAEGCDCSATDGSPIMPTGIVLTLILLGLARRRR